MEAAVAARMSSREFLSVGRIGGNYNYRGGFSRLECSRRRENPRSLAMGDFAVFDMDDGAETVVVLEAGGEDGAWTSYSITKTRPLSALWAIKSISGLKIDVVAVTFEFGHEIGATLDDARPTGEIVENFRRLCLQ